VLGLGGNLDSVWLDFPINNKHVANNLTAIEWVVERMVEIESLQFPIQVGYFKSRLLHVLNILTGDCSYRCPYIREAKRGRVAAVANEHIALERAFEGAGKLAGVAPVSIARVDFDPIAEVAVKSVVVNRNTQAASYRLRRIRGGVVERWKERATEPGKVVVAEIVAFDRHLERTWNILLILWIVDVIAHLERLEPQCVSPKVQLYEARHSGDGRASRISYRAITPQGHGRRIGHTSRGDKDGNVVVRSAEICLKQAGGQPGLGPS